MGVQPVYITDQYGNPVSTVLFGGAITQGTSPWAEKELRAATAATSSVNDQATNATLLVLNTNRLGFRIYNDSSADLYVKFGTTASATDFTVKMAPGGYLEDDQYTGRVDGIWSADASGAARITELT